MVAEGDGLRHLQVREARHRGRGFALGEVEQGALELRSGDRLMSSIESRR